MEQINGLLEMTIQEEFTVSKGLLWLRHGDSLKTQRKENVRHWKPGPKDRDGRRLSACCSELEIVRKGVRLNCN
jgi:hypothetical protein